ncbi:MAG: hypothetical protein KFB96_03510 [Thiocapsa sp.]|uniref:hypothetical protein n=1 Tax=Thiocapsa sp. TaxID=2024551 RepID=UPI001BD0AA26|nr:hypothetical protein [Thiocapsa sp.]QVL49585.1 MAG: hypothetical protein KFB96_03510 [Thiocapsa sp.]
MMPLLLSLITAVLFLILAGATYGAEALLTNAWIPMVFWGLLGSGVTVYILSKQAKQ